MSLSRAISGLWEPMSPITVTRDDMQEIRAEASRCLLVHQIRICDVKQSPPWTGEEIVEVAAQLLSWLVARPDRKIIRLIHIFAEDLNMKPMDTVNYALSVWRASSAHFSEDAHYIGDQKIPVIGTNAILLATLDWRPGPAVRPWLKESLLIANVASAALAAALMILRHRRYGESTPFGELELVNAQSDNSEGTQMFLQSTLDTIRRSQIDQGINVGQELGLVLGVNIQLSKDLCLWALQSDEERFAPASLLHPARRTLGSPWRKFCLCYGMGNEFIVNAIPPCLAMLEFRLPGVLERMYSKKRSEYMWMRIKHRQINRVENRSEKGVVALFQRLARQTGLPYSNVSAGAATPGEEMEVPFHNYAMTHQPITDSKGFLSFPFMTSVIKALDTEEEQNAAQEEEEVTVQYTHYLVNLSGAVQ